MKYFIYFTLLSLFPFIMIGQEIKSFDLVDVTNKVVGNGSVVQEKSGIILRIKAQNLKPGKHGMHFHEVGNCDLKDGFSAAGSHIRLANESHGYISDTGPHSGDLPNIVANSDGVAEGEFYITSLALRDCNRKAPIIDKDMIGNVKINKDGSVQNLELPVTLNKTQTCHLPILLDKDGSSLIIHENEDDHKTDPTGNSGSRILCGLIR